VSNSIRNIQEVLKAKGFDPGGIDGVWGRNTIAALRNFQTANKLDADGVLGPTTHGLLFTTGTAVAAAPAAADEEVFLPWFAEARHLLGTKETQGKGDNETILDWAANLDLHYPSDDIPWCGLFVAHCIGSTLPQEALPGNPLGARQWQTFGASVTPRTGAIMVFWRESRQSGKGHVGFYVGEDANAFQILGGNQSDRVSLAWIAKDRLLGARWPKSASSLVTSAVQRDRNQGLSSNEA
jgi:uncharacterized protein (TIGR02594 family)